MESGPRPAVDTQLITISRRAAPAQLRRGGAEGALLGHTGAPSASAALAQAKGAVWVSPSQSASVDWELRLPTPRAAQ